MTNDHRVAVPGPAASGVGSLPGGDQGAALRLVFDGLGGAPGLPYLPELPARGVGADMTGRTAGNLLVDIAIDLAPSGWRVADAPGRDQGRAVSHLRRDLDVLEELTQDYTGPLKLQAVGPWTLAATVELKHGDKVLADRGACRDMAESLAEGLSRHLAEVRRRVPGATSLVLQLDEPALPGVLRGTVPTASGFGRLRSVDEPLARDLLRRVIETAAPDGHVVVHCCAPGVPLTLLRDAGASAISLDWSLLRTRQDEQLAELIEAGTVLYAGAVPSLEPASAVPPNYQRIVDEILALRRIGLPARQIAGAVVVTPSCGLSGASPQWAARAQRLCLDAARALADVE
ncbi:methionine synthase [Actinospica durhamensis]|uniref:Methionine synthase n=1 Tax=Actinospica durhamensis TaxID=1508375 RepID=A0A941EWP2_9ACTN|nr:methionine synthase [Actinospica durhamensis]MBR7835324.1 methionine synthase [Actinospica durhamensis]